ncbi:hypothetical protein KEM52_005377 [Ascosphaera acerosa]|nr:hypothetical protein KEM52_005377 [Ascosphaera acerosa]
MAARPLNWINGLKARELQCLATAIGVASSGTKASLAERIRGTLARYAPRAGSQGTGTGEGEGMMADLEGRRPASVLSIDMGIRNLAFAHLLCGDGPHGQSGPPPVTLSAWNRLDVSLLDDGSKTAIEDIHTTWKPSTIQTARAQSKAKARRKRVAETDGAGTTSDQEVSASTAGGEAAEVAAAKESFAPETYARHAYSLTTSLLTKYRPTHILIERQRFRSGGGSAVQEWTIRVGMFEAMLYATLHTLRMEAATSVPAPTVVGVNPRRVAKYWIERRSEATGDHRSERASTARATKIAKNRVLLAWLTEQSHARERGAAHRQGHRQPPLSPPAVRLQLAGNPLVQALAQSYAAKCGGKGQAGAPSGHSASTQPIQLDKVDDLADCVLQGVAWIEWERLRGRLMRESSFDQAMKEVFSC